MRTVRPEQGQGLTDARGTDTQVLVLYKLRLHIHKICEMRRLK